MSSRQKLFAMRVVFVSAGFCMLYSGSPNITTAEAVPLPEYYGIYSVDGGKLFQITNQESQKAFTFHPDVYFIMFKGSPQQLMGFPAHTVIQLGKQSFVRYEIALETLSDPGADWPKHIKSVGGFSKWDRSEPRGLVDSCSEGDPSSEAFRKFCVELRAKPVPSQPEMTQYIPRQPLTPGVYYLNVLDGGWAWFFIGDKTQIEEYGRQTCVDRYIYSGSRVLISNKPCSEFDQYKNSRSR